jgi:hypothetical protein
MSLVDRAVSVMVSSVVEYEPRKVGTGVAHLGKLQLFVEIHELQAMAAGSTAVFVSEFTTSLRERARGMTVTCVGFAENLNSAVEDAVAQWTLGVLPVLAQWRGHHSCLSTPAAVETRAGVFEILRGPTIARGVAEETAAPVHCGGLMGSLIDMLRAARPAKRLHWLELFACKFENTEVDATCRLNNHDWPTATRTLKGVANGWPAGGTPMRSQRQFVLLRPQGDSAQEIILPTIWGRLMGRA